MKTILLAGCSDSTPVEAGSNHKPKSMIEVGGRPILTRVMDIFAHFGHTDFIVSTGGESVLMKQFFTNFHLMANDVVVSIDTGEVELRPAIGAGWKVGVIDTGTATASSGNLRRVRDWIGDESFMVAYSDSLGNIDIDALLEFHTSHGKLATVTAVRPIARSGGLELFDNRVTAFTETVRRDETWINGGFFVFEPAVFDYLVDDQVPLERAPLAQLAMDGELMAYRHYDFWHPMDTMRDQRLLSKYCAEEPPPWLRFGRRSDASDIRAAE